MLILVLSILFSQEINILAFTPENCSIHVSELTKQGFPNQEPWNFSENFTIIELDNSTGARCLDGSNFKFLYSPGYGSGSNKFMIFWQAASFCGAEGIDFFTSCYEKSKTFLGSSKDYAANGSTYTSTVPMGYFSSDPEYNPLFYNWNRISITYCDGTVALGNLEEPVLFNDTWLYFRGYNNTMQTLLYAGDKWGLRTASEVLLTGTSGSATSAFMWTSYLQEGFFSNETKIWTISDAGMFLDTYNEAAHCRLFKYNLQQLVNACNASSAPLLKKCEYSEDEEEVWKCFMPQYIYDQIKVPLFIMNTQDDYSQLTSVDYIECIADGGPFNCSAEEKYRINLRRQYFLNLVVGEIMVQKPQWGFWLRSCFEHTLAGTWAWYGNYTVFNANTLVSKNVKEALTEWYNNGDFLKNGVKYVDLIDWEHNPQCDINVWKLFINNS